MGGDEFVACFVEADKDTGAAFVARLQARIAAFVESDELPVPVSISAGMTHYPADGKDAQSLFAVADARLYEAKRASAA
jgi:diguanylate cyclase (GGDEF)-like protein